MILFWLAVAVVMGGTVGFLAHRKGRSGLLWGFYGLTLNIIALVHVILLKPLDDRTWTPMRFGVPEAPQTCPNCGASVRGEAVICRHCRQPLYRGEAAHQHARHPEEVYEEAAQSELPLGDAKPQPQPESRQKTKPKVESEAPSWLDESFARMSRNPEPPPAPQPTAPPKSEPRPQPQPTVQVRVETKPEPQPQFETRIEPKIEPKPEPVAPPIAAMMPEPPKVEATPIEQPHAPEPTPEEPKLEEPKLEEPALEEPKLEEPKLEEPKIAARGSEPPRVEPVQPEPVKAEAEKPAAAKPSPALTIFATAKAAFERPRPAPTVEPGMRIGDAPEPKPRRRPTLTADNVRAPLSSDSRPPRAARERRSGTSDGESRGTLKKVVGLAGLAALIGFLVPFAATFWPNIKSGGSQIASSLGTGAASNAAPPTPTPTPPSGEEVATPKPPVAPQPSEEQSAALTPPSSAAPSTPEAKPDAAKPDAAKPSAAATPKADTGAGAPVDLAPPDAKPAPEPKKAPPKPRVQKPLTQEEFAAMVDRALQKDAAEGGAGGDAVLAIQQKLRDRGYDPGSIDGRTGPKTVQAIRAFQRTVGMKPDGKIDMVLMERLGIVGPQINAFTENKR